MKNFFETSDILSYIYVYRFCVGHTSIFLLTFCMFLAIFQTTSSDIMSDVLGENAGHSVQNVGHVWLSEDFSY